MAEAMAQGSEICAVWEGEIAGSLSDRKSG